MTVAWIAVTGLGLVLFLVVHLGGVGLAAVAPDSFERYAAHLHGRPWLPAVELVLKWVLQDGLIRYKRYLFVVKDQMGFTFNCDFTKKSFGLLTEQMSQVVRSLLHA